MGFGHRNCVVNGCSNSGKKLNKWAESHCELHDCTRLMNNCDCKLFELFPFPTALKNNDRRLAWTKAVKRQDYNGKSWEPKKSSRICSEHFMQGKPTKEFPDPELDLGYVSNPKSSKRKAPTPRAELPSKRRRTKVEGLDGTRCSETLVDESVSSALHSTAIFSSSSRQSGRTQHIIDDHFYCYAWDEMEEKGFCDTEKCLSIRKEKDREILQLRETVEILSKEDWAQTQKLGHEKIRTNAHLAASRSSRRKEGSAKKATLEAAQALVSLNTLELECLSTSPGSFHKLPLNDPGRCKLWLRALDPNTSKETLRRRCILVGSDHFSPNDLIHHEGCTHPTPAAVPSAAHAAGQTAGSANVSAVTESATTQPIKSSPSPPLVKVKDEPIDDEYDQALISSTATANVKDEPNTAQISIQTDTVKVHSPSGPKILKNKAVLCRPLVQNKGVSCRTQTVDVESQTDDIFPKIMIVPVPVPVYVPVPMNLYSQYTPKPVGLPLPVPVPMFLPVTMDSAERILETIQEIKQKIPSDPFEAELILMAEMVAEQHENNDKEERPKEKVERERARQEAAAPVDHGSNYSVDLDTEDLASFLNNWEDVSDAGFRSPSRDPILDIPAGLTNEPYSEPQLPMDLEADVTVETLERMARLREQSKRSPSPPPAASRRRQAHRKAREKKGRKSQRSSSKTVEASTTHKAVAVEVPKLKSQYGVDAWKRWIQWRQTQPNLEKPRFGSRPIELKEDVLSCTTAELSYGLCSFIAEVKRPNREPYSPDTLFYLCLGIQQHLFENGRVENIFMDRFYSKFSTEFTNNLRDFKPSITAAGYIHSRVEEEFLWDCKQLGAYSPIVLLNTLLFFCCKYFGFTTVEQHRQLSFAHVMRCTKTNQNNTKTTFLRFYPPISINEAEPGTSMAEGQD